MLMQEGDVLGRVQLVVFRLGDEEFGVEIGQVREIIKMIEVTQMPNCPDFMQGVINLRGQVTAVMDLRKKLGISANNEEKDARILIVELDDKTVGMIVDSVTEVLRIPTKDLDDADIITSQVEANYIRGVGKLEDKILILLDLNKVLTTREIAQVEQVGEEVVA